MKEPRKLRMNKMVKEFFKTKEDDNANCGIDLKNEELKVEPMSPSVTIDSKGSRKRTRITADGSRRSIESQSSLNLKSALKKSSFDVASKRLRSNTIEL